MPANHETYDALPKLVKTRMSVRKFRPDPIPEDTINKILEVARRPLADIVHRERYEMSKYMSNEDVIKYLHSLREATVPIHSAARSVNADEKK